MDLNLAKQKLAAAQNKGGQQREKIDYTKIFLIGTKTIKTQFYENNIHQ